MSWWSSMWEVLKDIFWLIVRRKKQQDDPINQIQNEREQFQKAAVDGDEKTANAFISSELQRMRDQQAAKHRDNP